MLPFCATAASFPGEVADAAGPGGRLSIYKVKNHLLKTVDGDNLFLDGDKLVAWTSVTGLNSGFIEHVWYRDDVVARFYLPVGAGRRWRFGCPPCRSRPTTSRCWGPMGRSCGRSPSPSTACAASERLSRPRRAAAGPSESTAAPDDPGVVRTPALLACIARRAHRLREAQTHSSAFDGQPTQWSLRPGDADRSRGGWGRRAAIIVVTGRGRLRPAACRSAAKDEAGQAAATTASPAIPPACPRSAAGSG